MVEPAKRNFSTALVSLRESVESQSISEESEVELNDQEEGEERYQSQDSEQREEESFLESALSFSRRSSGSEDISVWRLFTVSQEELMLGGLIILVLVILLYSNI